MAFYFINESVSERKTTHFDWWGALTLGAALSSLVLVLDKGLSWGWISTNSLLSYLAIVVFTMIFIKIEHGSAEPIVDLKFFKNSVFVNTLANNFVVFMGMMGSVFLIPVFAQTFLGYGATQTGYLFIPMAAALMLAAPIGGALNGRVKPGYVIAASTLVAGLGLYWFSFLDARSGPLGIILPLSVMAFGMGFGMSQRTSIIAMVVPQSEIGVASSILALARNIAGAFGIAVFGTILTNSINANVLRFSANSTLGLRNSTTYTQFIGLIIAKAEISAYGTVFLISSALVIAGAALALTIKIKNIRTDIKVHVE